MRFPPDIQKIEREKRKKKRELTSPLRMKRKMKPPVPTKPKDLPESRESQPIERKGEVSSKISTEEPKDLPESRESQLVERKGEISSEISMGDPKDLPDSRESRPEERKGEASSSSSVVRMVQTKLVTSEIMLSMLIQNQGLAIVTTNNTYASVADILQRDLWIEPGEATIWS